MDATKFEALMIRFEGMAVRKPTRYRILVLGVVAGGIVLFVFAAGLVVIGAIAALGAIALLFFFTTRGFEPKMQGLAVMLLAPFARLFFLILLPVRVVGMAALGRLFAPFPEPQGRELTPGETPALFAAIAGVRQHLRGPRLHKVLLTNAIGAGIGQHPRLGLFGWNRNILTLGLPLLQILSEDEARSVLAHEYAHLSGRHCPLSRYIYRARAAWNRVQDLSEQWTDPGSRLFARLMRWYAPYFNACTFVIARQNEYAADRTAIEVAGRADTATAVMRTDLASEFATSMFQSAIDRRAAEDPEPLDSLSTFWRDTIHTAFRQRRCRQCLDQVLQRRTNYFDTHPALIDRLAAMGVTADDAAAVALSDLPAETASDRWLGTTLPIVQGEFDRAWRDQIIEAWCQRHTELRKERLLIDCLNGVPMLSVQVPWNNIRLFAELLPGTNTAGDKHTPQSATISALHAGTWTTNSSATCSTCSSMPESRPNRPQWHGGARNGCGRAPAATNRDA
jgi:Zn-dependent protease with chaperone function